MTKIKYTKFIIGASNLVPDALFGVTITGNQKLIGIFPNRETANFIKRLLTATLIKKGK